MRRIEAVTGEAAENILDTLSDTLKGISTMFNNAPDVAAAVAKLISENSDAKKKIEEYAKEKAASFAKVISENAEEINGIKVVKFSRDVDPAMLREAGRSSRRKWRISRLPPPSATKENLSLS